MINSYKSRLFLRTALGLLFAFTSSVEASIHKEDPRESSGTSCSLVATRDLPAFMDTLQRFKQASSPHGALQTLKEDAPRCFISYAWGNPEQENLVHTLASHLKEAGINVLLDIWHNKGGTAISQFAEQIIPADFVIVAGSRNLVDKYYGENPSVVKVELGMVFTKFTGKSHTVLPIILEETHRTTLPPFLWNTVSIGFQDRKAYTNNCISLLERLYHPASSSPFAASFKKIVFKEDTGSAFHMPAPFQLKKVPAPGTPWILALEGTRPAFSMSLLQQLEEKVEQALQSSLKHKLAQVLGEPLDSSLTLPRLFYLQEAFSVIAASPQNAPAALLMSLPHHPYTPEALLKYLSSKDKELPQEHLSNLTLAQTYPALMVPFLEENYNRFLLLDSRKAVQAGHNFLLSDIFKGASSSKSIKITNHKGQELILSTPEDYLQHVTVPALLSTPGAKVIALGTPRSPVKKSGLFKSSASPFLLEAFYGDLLKENQSAPVFSIPDGMPEEKNELKAAQQAIQGSSQWPALLKAIKEEYEARQIPLFPELIALMAEQVTGKNFDFHLALVRQNLQDLSAWDIRQFLQQQDLSLAGLNLSHNSLRAQGLQFLQPAFETLKALDLSYNKLEDKGIFILARNLGAGLQRLALAQTGLTFRGIQALFSKPYPALKELDLSRNTLGDSSAALIAKLPALTTLGLAGGDITDEGAKALLGNKTLVSLNLERNRTVKGVTSVIAGHPALTSLNLSHNKIMDEELLELVQALRHGSRLQVLNLYYNALHSSSAEALAKWLQTGSPLKDLNLCNNNIQAAGAKALGQALGRNSSLTILGLEKNPLNGESILELLKGARQNTHLQELMLGPVILDDKHQQMLQELKQVHPSLKVVIH